jgi:transcriptional regulator with XRE-family HTH domain
VRAFSGLRLQEARQEKGVKVVRVAAEVDLTEATVRDHERGVPPRADVLGRYADYFGISTDFFFVEVDPTADLTDDPWRVIVRITQ